MIPPLCDLLAGLGVGLVGGVTSGLLGVSPGGGLVVSANLLLSAEQHVAQGISLFAQIPPTGLSGIKRYWEKGSRTPTSWLVHLGIGFLIGGVAGALAAGSVSSSFLRWTYVVYLAALDAMLIYRPSDSRPEATPRNFTGPLCWPALLGVGFLAGFSSGFLGIGGGLAIPAELSAGLRVPRHQAQLVGLVFSIIPTTIPAGVDLLAGRLVRAVVADRRGRHRALGGNRSRRSHGQPGRHRTLLGFVSAMAIYMACRALARGAPAARRRPLWHSRWDKTATL
jgi:uncharacterized protein